MSGPGLSKFVWLGNDKDRHPACRLLDAGLDNCSWMWSRSDCVEAERPSLAGPRNAVHLSPNFNGSPRHAMDKIGGTLNDDYPTGSVPFFLSWACQAARMARLSNAFPGIALDLSRQRGQLSMYRAPVYLMRDDSNQSRATRYHGPRRLYQEKPGNGEHPTSITIPLGLSHPPTATAARLHALH